jgi:Ca-activated chloride channel family protein
MDAGAKAVITRPVHLLCVALVLLATPMAGAQKFSSRTLGVRVDVLVTEGRNPVGGLTAGDFELRDNGVLQHVEVADPSDVPVNVVLALDTSGSLQGKRQTDLIGAAQSLLDGLTPADRAALTTFDHAVRPAIALTGDLKAVRAALDRITPIGQTAVIDGTYVALTSTLDQAGRFLVVVCTDGTDTASWLQPAEVLEVAKRTNAVLYAVTSADAKRSDALKQIAETTGGQMMPVKSSDELRSTFQRILAEFRSRYVLAYTPQGVPPGGFHRVDVTVPRRHVTVKARPGYAGAEGRQP